MSRYKPASSRDQHSAPPIPDDDLEIVLADFSARRDAPTLTAYFSAIVCNPFTTQRERDATLVAVRKAWVAALCRHDVNPLHATCFVMKHELRVREYMRTVDRSSGRQPDISSAGNAMEART